MPSQEDGVPSKSWRSPLAVASTYFAEGFPYAIVNNIPEVFFRELGFPIEIVGLTSLLHKPWNFKFLWAPLCESVSRRRLLAACQLAMGGLLLLPSTAACWGSNPYCLFAIFALIAVFSATNDIAIDGYYLEALRADEQSRWVGLRQIAYRASNLLVRGPLLGLAAWLGFTRAFAMMGTVLLCLGVGHFLFLPREKSESGDKAPPSSLAMTMRSLLEVPNIAVLVPFAISFRAGEALLQKMRYSFLKEQFLVGVGEYATLSGTFGIVASLLGTTIGGALLAKHGLRRWFWPFVLSQNFLNLLYGMLALGWFGKTHGAAWTVVLLDEFGSGLGTSALLVFLMHLCRGEHKTTHFAFWTALMSLVFTYGGAVSGYLAKSLGFANFFFATFACSVPMMLLAFLIPQTREGALRSVRTLGEGD